MAHQSLVPFNYNGPPGPMMQPPLGMNTFMNNMNSFIGTIPKHITPMPDAPQFDADTFRQISCIMPDQSLDRQMQTNGMIIMQNPNGQGMIGLPNPAPMCELPHPGLLYEHKSVGQKGVQYQQVALLGYHNDRMGLMEYNFNSRRKNLPH